MDDLIDQFLAYVELELGLAHNTSLAYRADLVDFAAFCDRSRTVLSRATPETISKYQQFLQEER
jgi:site-specific recombinase XerD